MILFFCPTCSSPLFVKDSSHSSSSSSSSTTTAQDDEQDKYWVPTGVLDQRGNDDDATATPKLKMDWGIQVFVGDTVDGGASNWFLGAEKEEGKRWLGAGGESERVSEAGEYWPAGLENLGGTARGLKEEKGHVRLKCHCGGVDLVIKAGEAQREFEQLSVGPGKEKEKGEGTPGNVLPWFVDPVTHKSLATLDGCDSCRIWSGVEVFNWTFYMLKHVGFGTVEGEGEEGAGEGFPTDTKELQAAIDRGSDKRFGTLAYYASSPDVQRYHCGRCSAAVFYALDRRPDMVDVAVGLLHSPDGARAETMLTWELGGPIGWRGDMAGTWREDLLNMVEKGSESWRVKRGYPQSWRRTAKND